MSDDLISRKAVLEKLRLLDDRKNGNENFLFGIETSAEIIENEPAAFDEEKVMRELYEKYRFAEKVYEEDKKSSGDPYTGSKFIMDAYKNSIEIVENGGIE